MTRPDNPNSERVLILAPHGRDAGLALTLLREANLAAVVVPNLPGLVQGLGEVAGAVLVTEEAVRTTDLTLLSR